MASPVRQRARRATNVPVTTTARPALAVVEGRRRVAWFAVTLSLMIGGVMVGALALHTRISERQLQIDGLERSVRQAQTDFDVLRAARAELRSPTRLADRAGELGMVPGDESEFLTVVPMTYAVLIAATGEIPVADVIGAGANTRLEPLDQFRLVKSVSSEVP
jgi:cell division protein FtsL